MNWWLILLIVWLAPVVLSAALLLWHATNETFERRQTARQTQRAALRAEGCQVQREVVGETGVFFRRQPEADGKLNGTAQGGSPNERADLSA